MVTSWLQGSRLEYLSSRPKSAGDLLRIQERSQKEEYRSRVVHRQRVSTVVFGLRSRSRLLALIQSIG